MKPGAEAVRLLLVEDDLFDAELAERTLSQGGFEPRITRVETEADLRRELAANPPEAVLCDYHLPVFDAPRALAVTRELAPELPFLCLSGTIGEEQAVDMLKNGATDFVMKDRPGRLAPALRRALKEAREHAELRSSREQLLQSQKMEAVGRLAGGVAHDFNNILTTISGYSELVLQGLPPDSPLREEVGEIVSAAERAAKLTRQLLAFSRRQVLEVRVLDLNEVVRGLERLLSRVIGEDVRVQLALAPALKRVRADASQLEQVLMNLAVNARDAMPKGGLLVVSTRDNGASVELSVADTGTGMTPEVRARAFEPFFTTKEKGKGTGLGLATVYGIVTQSGGTVDLESEPGRGTRFVIRLPATDATAEPEHRTRPAAAPPGSGELILLVEDEAPLRALMRRILCEHGYRVLEAAGPAEALRSAEPEPPAAAVVDIVMPGMDGAALVARLRAKRPGLRVLFVSGYADQAVIPLPESGRPFPFLPKPFTTPEFLAKLRETLE